MSATTPIPPARVQESLPTRSQAPLPTRAQAPLPARAQAPLPERLVAATHDVAELVARVPHDSGCPRRFEQTSEFACTCSRRQLYRRLQSVLRDAHTEITRHPTTD